MKLHLQDARDGCIDLGLGDLPIHHCLVQPKDHMLCIGQATRAEQQVRAGLYRQGRGLGEAIGVADTAHPECVANNHSFEIKLLAQ